MISRRQYVGRPAYPVSTTPDITPKFDWKAICAILMIVASFFLGDHHAMAQLPRLDDAWRHLAPPAKTAAILGSRMSDDQYARINSDQQPHYVKLLERSAWLPVDIREVGRLTGGKLVATAGQHAYVVRAISLQQPYTGGYALYYSEQELAVTYQALGGTASLKREALLVLLPQPLSELYVWYGISQ